MAPQGVKVSRCLPDVDLLVWDAPQARQIEFVASAGRFGAWWLAMVEFVELLPGSLVMEGFSASCQAEPAR